jgi:hypothetical protein
LVSQQNEPPEKEEKEPIKVSFSLPQLIGGALAAATAAAVGSTLGVAGTILGAAVASVVGGVGGTLYSAGIDRTHRKVASVITRTGTVPLEPADGVDLTLVDVTAGAPPVAGSASGSASGSAGGDGPSGRKRRIWKVAAITAAAIFAVSLVVITAVELGLGRAFGGGEGTTVSQVVRPQAKPSKSPKPTPRPTPSETVTSAAPEPSPSESVTPAPSESTEPSLAPTPAVEPTVTVTPAANTEAPAAQPTS